MKTAQKSLHFLQIEMIVTGTLMAMPIMVPFYHSIGMDQGQIGLSQSIFTAALLVLNVPTGWIADRFNRKWSNTFGDLGCALALLFYAQATCFADVIVAEIVFGIAAAFSQGADSALLKAHTCTIDRSGALFLKQNALLETWRPIAQVIALVIGGVVGATDLRLAIAISAIPYGIGCALSLFVKEEGERLISQHRNPLRDMARVARESVGTDPRLRWLIAAYAIGREVTHVMIWALTPLLILAGVPLGIVAVGWVLNSLSVALGAHTAHRWAHPLSDWQKFALPVGAVTISLIVMSLHLSLVTVWVYAVLGIAQGWSAATLMPLVQAKAPASSQATIVSIAKSASQLLYIPLVWVIGIAGEVDIRLTMVATLVVFVPLAAITAQRLYFLERR